MLMAQIRGKEKREPWAIRMTDTEKAAIHDRAQQLDMSMTEYMIRSALGELQDPHALERQLADVEKRLDALERLASLGSYG